MANIMKRGANMGVGNDTDFKIVVETTNKEYTNGQKALVHNLEGRGYALFVMNEKGLQVLRQGVLLEDILMEAFVATATAMNARFKLLAALTVELEDIDMEHEIVESMIKMAKTTASGMNEKMQDALKTYVAEAVKAAERAKTE